MKDYRKILLVMILIFSLWNVITLLSLNIAAIENNGICVISFNIIGEMYVEIALWVSYIILIIIFIIGGFFDHKKTIL